MNKMTIMVAVVLVAGCTGTVTPRYDPLFGTALKDARMAMTIDPAAASRIDQVRGMDGQAARETVKRYQDSFKEPPPVTNVINIGGAIGGTGK